MTDSSDYRKYLDSQFSRVHDSLANIELQTTKTNGRVNELENDINKIKEDIIKHPIDCSKGKDIDDIKDWVNSAKTLKSIGRQNLENFIKISGLTVAFLMLLAAIYFGFKHADKKQDKILTGQEKMSIPVVVNKRGALLTLPDSSQIFYFNNDSVSFLVKRIR
jgi:hypothetical protein